MAHDFGTKSSVLHLARGVQPPICKKPHANTFAVRTWDLMPSRPSRVLVTNPDRQLPCHFSKTVLRIPSTGELPVVHTVIVCGFWQGAPYSGAYPVFVWFFLSLFSLNSLMWQSSISSSVYILSGRAIQNSTNAL